MDTLQNETKLSSRERSGYDPKTGIYHSLIQLKGKQRIPTTAHLDTATFVLSRFPRAESKVALIDSSTNRRVTYGELQRSIHSLAAGLYHGLGVRKGDVVFLLSPNSILYPTICLAILLVGGVVTTANPVNTQQEITKQVVDSGAKLAIASPEEMHKLTSTNVPTLVTNCCYSVGNENELSVQELIDCCDQSLVLPENQTAQSDTAAILYSSGTTGTSKGVILTHGNLISMMTLLIWAVDMTSAKDDIFLCFIPMFHVYGLAFFGLGLLCSGTTTVLMQRFDFQGGYDLSSLRSVGSGAAPLSKHVAHRFRAKFPWVELKPGYGLTESCGAAGFFVSSEEAKARSAASGGLLPTFSAKVVDIERGVAQPPYGEGELWLKGPAVMKGYLGNEAATNATMVDDGWLRTGDLCYFDEDGYLFIVDRIKELIKHKGYQVAPAELEAILLNHPHILDVAVIPLEDEEAGEVPMAYIVRETGYELNEDQVIQFVAGQVAPYKRIKRVAFINEIPKSVAGKILRKDLMAQSKQNIRSKL
nr:4-coumarate--CoA ligase-like 5 [Tanacetum cinerariifolium]